MDVMLRQVCIAAGLALWGLVVATPAQSLEASASCPAALPQTYIPSYGQTYVNRDNVGPYIWNWFYFDKPSRLADYASRSDSTLEIHNVFYNYPGALLSNKGPSYVGSATGFFQTNMLSAYIDTELGNDDAEKNLGLGTYDAVLLLSGRLYYFAMRVAPGPGAFSQTKVYPSRGRRIPIGCYAAVCVYGCTTDNRQQVVAFADNFFSPGCRRYWFMYNSTLNQPCPP